MASLAKTADWLSNILNKLKQGIATKEHLCVQGGCFERNILNKLKQGIATWASAILGPDMPSNILNKLKQGIATRLVLHLIA